MEEEEETEHMKMLLKRYHTLLRVVHEDYWQEMMGPVWNRERLRLQQKAEELLDQREMDKSSF